MYLIYLLKIPGSHIFSRIIISYPLADSFEYLLCQQMAPTTIVVVRISRLSEIRIYPDHLTDRKSMPKSGFPNCLMNTRLHFSRRFTIASYYSSIIYYFMTLLLNTLCSIFGHC